MDIFNADMGLAWAGSFVWMSRAATASWISGPTGGGDGKSGAPRESLGARHNYIAGGLSLAGARIPMRLLDMPPAALTWARAAGLSRWRWGLTRDGGCSTGWKGSCLLGNPMRRVECLEKSRVGGVSTMSSSSTPTPGIRRGRSRQREGRTSKHVQNLPVWADSGATWAAGNRRQRVWHQVGVGRRRLVSPTHPWAMRAGAHRLTVSQGVGGCAGNASERSELPSSCC